MGSILMILRNLMFQVTAQYKCDRGGKHRTSTGAQSKGLSLSVRQKLRSLANGLPLTFSSCFLDSSPNLFRNNDDTNET